MSPANVEISKIGPESDAVLSNLFEHYCYELSEFFDLDTEADGRYAYDTASIWANGFDAYLLKIDGALAGFAVIGSAGEWLDDAKARDIHEFFVLRKFRRKGLGRKLAEYLWNEHTGRWLVRVLESNAPAVVFWRKSISAYTNDQFPEEQRIIADRSWRFFTFDGRVKG